MQQAGINAAANRLLEEFVQPSTAYRSVPFWAWNDRMSVDEVKAQIQEMSKQGMGGFFMHSREGLESEYMGEEWMACIQAAVAEAKATGMKAWLYDEDRFPSGGAGGSVPRLGGDAYRSKAITMEVTRDEPKDTSDIIGLFVASVEGDTLLTCRQVDTTEPDLLLDSEVWLICRKEISGPCEWFNDEAPVDNLNPNAVAAFIEGTHEHYKAVIGEEFGQTVPGIFTDEPSIADFHSLYTKPWLPWTDGFAEYFQERRGSSLEALLPYLFFHGEHSAKARHNYWRTITERFCAAYSEQLGQWCEDNGIAYTGHYLIEHNLGIGTRVSGAIMPHYRYQQVPGIDLLGEQADEFMTVKQCTSVANQYRRPFVLSEMYGCCGWDFTFEGQKWVGDWQFALGVNVRCQHLSLYSLKGCRKRDFPPVFNYNTSWWKYNHVTEDYFARIAAVMTQGEAVRDVLVIHPSSTIWAMIGCDPYEYKGWEDPNLLRANRYEDGINSIIRSILAFHYDFDFGDETIIEEKGHVTEGKFFVNFAGYQVVVLPRLHTLLGSTLKLLLEFMDEGGTIIAVGQEITMVDGELSDEVQTLYSHAGIRIVVDEAELCSTLEDALPRQVGIRSRTSGEAPEFLYYLKEMPDCYALFVVNNDRDKGQEVEIMLAHMGRLEEWDTLTGETKELGIEVSGDHMRFVADFGPAGSKLYVIHKGFQPRLSENRFSSSQSHLFRLADATLGPACAFTRTMPNALLLDVCSYRMRDENWSEPMFVWQAQMCVREALNMRQVHYNGLPQRYKWVDEAHPDNGQPIGLRYIFQVNAVPITDVFLVLEQAEQYEVCLNGVPVAVEIAGWYIDKSFKKMKLPQLNKGTNELVITCAYESKFEWEDCYIIGDFGVDVNRSIVKEPEVLHMGDWCLQGYFHYSGSIVYHFDYTYAYQPGVAAPSVLMEFGTYEAITMEVRVNGVTSAHVPWREANKVDLTPWISEGSNRIDVEVMGSPRNLFGPFHQKGTHNVWVDWTYFYREGARVEPNYVVRPYGLLSPINLFLT
ncbi:hypothetical protein Back11_07780 [Paenibacillus baekrokdamisoli]|uniref:Uncharacterized protein n=1 Tax=Paenibacillus baekrokdamisoli TaxID=1712516 RepID=A0A3G9J3Z2_9BACL|nr:glycosyl hydrolase [Paenibacillus baekrokdamisoli]MBB3067380.1 hypothetical protein [Paenibacillus baekrokdamisoli]BBH19433.1 hypothetical protein Back11_07780 [Paenibacillus baekrokdamisoli]